MGKHKLTIGVTSWNSAPLLNACLGSIRATIGKLARVIVLDNLSSDGSDAVARNAGAEVVSRRCSQADAMNYLFAMSNSRYTLLIHADVVMLNPHWFDLCLRQFHEDIALVSPEDVGCGPYTRFWGGEKPESSFLLFDTKQARDARPWFWRQRFKIKWPYRALDFTGEHVTYNLPEMLARRNRRAALMSVHPSPEDLDPPFALGFAPKYWRVGFERLRYGLGNFYSLDGEITHYHNWYDRAGPAGAAISSDSTAEYPAEGGFPLAWLQTCSRRFLSDWDTGAVRLPSLAEARGARELAVAPT
jgi:glycosyltransferase involved in cell wall biosynthesis